MKMSYFEDTDTLYIEFKSVDVVDSKDIDENTVMDLDSQGNMITITIVQASQRTDVHSLTLSRIAA